MLQKLLMNTVKTVIESLWNSFTDGHRICIIHIQRLKKQSIDFKVLDHKKIIVKNYQKHNGTIVGFIT